MSKLEGGGEKKSWRIGGVRKEEEIKSCVSLRKEEEERGRVGLLVKKGKETKTWVG